MFTDKYEKIKHPITLPTYYTCGVRHTEENIEKYKSLKKVYEVYHYEGMHRPPKFIIAYTPENYKENTLIASKIFTEHLNNQIKEADTSLYYYLDKPIWDKIKYAIGKAHSYTKYNKPDKEVIREKTIEALKEIPEVTEYPHLVDAVINKHYRDEYELYLFDSLIKEVSEIVKEKNYTDAETIYNSICNYVYILNTSRYGLIILDEPVFMGKDFATIVYEIFYIINEKLCEEYYTMDNMVEEVINLTKEIPDFNVDERRYVTNLVNKLNDMKYRLHLQKDEIIETVFKNMELKK